MRMERPALCSLNAVMASWTARTRATRRPAVVSDSPTLQLLWGLLARTFGTLSLLENVLNLGVPREERCGPVLMDPHSQLFPGSERPSRGVFPMISTLADVHTLALTKPHAAGGVSSCTV